VRAVRASDKRITCDEEFSDSEDEGEGGRRHQESFKHKRIRLEDKTEGKTAAAVDKRLYLLSSFTVICELPDGHIILTTCSSLRCSGLVE